MISPGLEAANFPSRVTTTEWQRVMEAKNGDQVSWDSVSTPRRTPSGPLNFLNVITFWVRVLERKETAFLGAGGGIRFWIWV